MHRAAGRTELQERRAATCARMHREDWGCQGERLGLCRDKRRGLSSGEGTDGDIGVFGKGQNERAAC